MMSEAEPSSPRLFAESLGDAAVLFVDTCAYLDILRIPVRDDFDPARTLRAVSHLVVHPQLQIVSAQVLREEYARNVPRVRTVAENELRNLDRRLARATETVQALEPAADSIPSIRDYGIVARVEGIAERALCATTIIEESPGITLRASRRQGECRYPAQRGKDSHGDCLMVETLYELADELGGSNEIVFMSSNKSDYCRSDGSLHQGLDKEFGDRRIQFVTDWAWARGVICRDE